MITKNDIAKYMKQTYNTYFYNGDLSQPGVFGTNTAIRMNTSESKCTYLEFMSTDEWILDTFTTSVWINIPNTGGGFQTLIHSSAHSTSKLCVTYGGATTPYIQSNGFIVADKSFNLNEWTHLAFVRDSSSNFYMFENGELANTPQNFGGSNAFETYWSNVIIWIGKGYSNFNGLMDDLVLTKDILWTSDFTVPDKPMVKAYPTTNFLLNLGTIARPYSYSDDNIFKVY